MERLDLVQFHWWDYAVPRYLDVLGWLKDASGRRQDRPDRRHQLRYAQGAGNPGGRHAADVDAGAVFAAGPHAPNASCCRWRMDRDLWLFCYGTVAGGFLGDRWLGAARAARAAREPLADQVQADHRRHRRLGSSSRRCCDHAARHRRPRTGWTSPPSPRAAMLDRPGGRRHRGRAQPGAPGRQPRGGDAAPDRGRPCRDRRDPRAVAQSPKATSTRWSATATARTAAIMKYNLNKGQLPERPPLGQGPVRRERPDGPGQRPDTQQRGHHEEPASCLGRRAGADARPGRRLRHHHRRRAGTDRPGRRLRPGRRQVDRDGVPRPQRRRRRRRLHARQADVRDSQSQGNVAVDAGEPSSSRSRRCRRSSAASSPDVDSDPDLGHRAGQGACRCRPPRPRRR
jgi:hypothetical protein